MLEIGDALPDIAVPDQTGTPRKLRDLSSDWLVVVFYPKDFTSG